jgi:hypothetical protein
MRYFVALGAGEIPVDVTLLPSGGYGVRIDGKDVAVDAVTAGDSLSVRVDGRVIDLLLDGTPPEVRFVASGVRGTATIETERTAPAVPPADTAKGPETSPRRCRDAWCALVAPGDNVETGAARRHRSHENGKRAPRAARGARGVGARQGR